VALADGWVLATASTGPGSTDGGVYRRPVGEPAAPFARCGDDAADGGMPATFPYNVDTFTLAASGTLVAVGTPTGELYVSEDSGGTWRRVGASLPGIHCVDFAA
jgi:hypothetical protein